MLFSPDSGLGFFGKRAMQDSSIEGPQFQQFSRGRMETGRHCAYNVTRNVLLSERVSRVDESLDEGELLEMLMNGPGLDRHSGVWVGRATGWIDLPRLLALDFAYLDERQTIVESGGVGPGTGFPPVSEEVTGALILANRRLAETGVVAGDQVRICEQAELAALVKAASRSSMQAVESLAQPALSHASMAQFTAFEVSRYSEFFFEPFAGSLVYMPFAEAPPPQSTEYFLPDQPKAATGNAAPAEPAEFVRTAPFDSPVMDAEGTNLEVDKSAKIVARSGKQTGKKPAAPQEEPHFHTPEPIRFFDPAATLDKKELQETAVTGELAARQAPQRSPELKAAIVRIDEQLRGEKEELENRGKKRWPRKGKRKLEKKTRLDIGEQESVEAAAWEELAETVAPPESMVAAEAEAVEKIFEEAETSAEAVELQPLPTPAAPVGPLEPTIGAEGKAIEEVLEETETSAEMTVELQPPPTPVAPVAPAEPMVAAPPTPAAPAGPPELMVSAEETVEEVFGEAETPAETTIELQSLPTLTELEPEVEFEAEPEVETEIELEGEPEIAAAMPFSALGSIEAATAPPESLSLAEEIPPPFETVPQAPPEPEFVAYASGTAISESDVYLPPAETVSRLPRDIAEPEEPPVEKPKRRVGKISLGERLHRWIGGEVSLTGDRRRGERAALPGLVAFYWSGGAPRPHEIVNISKTGFYVRTKDLWLPNTLVRMTLQRPDEAEGSGRESISVLARVVRIDEDGVGHEFVTSQDLRNVRTRDVLPVQGTNMKLLEKFLAPD